MGYLKSVSHEIESSFRMKLSRPILRRNLFMAQYQITVGEELLHQLFVGTDRDAGVAMLLETVLNQVHPGDGPAGGGMSIVK